MQNAGKVEMVGFTFYWQIADGEVHGFAVCESKVLDATRGWYRTDNPAYAATLCESLMELDSILDDSERIASSMEG